MILEALAILGGWMLAISIIVYPPMRSFFFGMIWTIIKLAVVATIIGWLGYMIFSNSIAVAIVVSAALIAYVILIKKG